MPLHFPHTHTRWFSPLFPAAQEVCQIETGFSLPPLFLKRQSLFPPAPSRAHRQKRNLALKEKREKSSTVFFWPPENATHRRIDKICHVRSSKSPTTFCEIILPSLCGLPFQTELDNHHQLLSEERGESEEEWARALAARARSKKEGSGLPATS